jgi:hypothetical protein
MPSYPIVATLPDMTIGDARSAQHASALIVGSNNERVASKMLCDSSRLGGRDIAAASRHLDVSRDMASDARIVTNTITDTVIQQALTFSVQALYVGIIDAQDIINEAISDEAARKYVTL